MSSRLVHTWAACALVASAVAIACTGTLDTLPSVSLSSSGASADGSSGSPGSSGSSSGGSGTSPDDMDPDAAAEIPFEPVPARVYVAKVKNLMLGLPATEDEISAVEQDPSALRDMVDACSCAPKRKPSSARSSKKRSSKLRSRKMISSIS